jgi:hypothetical protein
MATTTATVVGAAVVERVLAIVTGGTPVWLSVVARDEQAGVWEVAVGWDDRDGQRWLRDLDDSDVLDLELGVAQDAVIVLELTD